MSMKLTPGCCIIVYIDTYVVVPKCVAVLGNRPVILLTVFFSINLYLLSTDLIMNYAAGRVNFFDEISLIA